MPKLGMEPVRRRQLIEATIASIHEDGFQDATVARISRRAGLSVGMVNHYFDGKGELLEATMQSLAAESMAGAQALLKGATGPEEELLAIIDGNFAPSQRSPEAISAWLSFYAQVPGNAEFARIQLEMDRELLTLLRPRLEKLVAPERVESRAQAIVALIYGLWLRHTQDAEGFNLDVVRQISREHVADIVAAG
jgi:TetR/AcrR family transcriptional repressor of bet genes